MNSDDNFYVADLIQEWRPTEARYLEHSYPRDTLDVVATVDEQIVGWISYKIKPCNPDVLATYEDSTENWLYIVEVFVSPSSRRHGVGSQLLSFAEAQGKSADVRYSIVMPEAGDGAHGFTPGLYEFYNERGYELMEPSRKNYSGAEPWLMGLKL
ncbi:GNAT family N-acetyltransferase [Glutamicibacter ardleyensis]|nr:GNAT family N-acetyltransferase [Glutamicibacter ardleyensis]